MGRAWVTAAMLLVGVAARGFFHTELPLCSKCNGTSQRRVSSPMGLPDAPMPVEAEPVAAKNVAAERTSEVLAGDPYRPLTAHQKWDHFLHRTYSQRDILRRRGRNGRRAMASRSR